MGRRKKEGAPLFWACNFTWHAFVKTQKREDENGKIVFHYKCRNCDAKMTDNGEMYNDTKYLYA